MKRLRALICALAIVLVTGGCLWVGGAEPSSAKSIEENRARYAAPAESLNGEAQALYDSTVMTLLKEDLWTQRDMYDSAHYLMVPMYQAFQSGNTAAMKAFAKFFARFTSDVCGEDAYYFLEQGFLNRLQFLYFSTQFMNLCAAGGYDTLIPRELPGLAQDCAQDYLYETTANWSTEPTVIEHIRQVIAGKQYEFSYYGVIDDLEMFSLAILCDLNCLSGLQGTTPTESMETAADLTFQLLSSPALNQETEGNGWLFQVGVWRDYADMAYAGNQRVCEGIQPKPRDDITEDTSHFCRMPLFLNSYLTAQTEPERREVFTRRMEQLANQMVQYVLKQVDGQWLTTTFMDGTNGVYRYSYDTPGIGLAGYDLSGTFLLGWWALLRDDRIVGCYDDILETFPMEGNRSNPYFDFATVREQNPFFDMETGFDKGMFEVMTACAGSIR